MQRSTEALHFVVPVWGPSYTDVFVNAALPAQLARRNLGALRFPGRAVYRIFSTREDLAVLRAAASFRSLDASVCVEIHEVQLGSDRRYGLMSACHREAILRADAEQAGLVFLNADLVLADGTFEKLETWIDEGVRVVECASLRVAQSAAVTRLRERHLDRETGAVSATPGQLVGLALEHLHENAAAHLWERPDATDLIPANLMWRVDDEGFLLHCFHLHPLLVVPERRGVSFAGTIDDDYVEAACPDPAMARIVTDSDELFFCELSDESHPKGGTIAGGSRLALANWIRRTTRTRQRELVRHAIRLHAGPRTAERWAVAEAEASSLVAACTTLAARLPFSVPNRLSHGLRAVERATRRLFPWSPAAP